MKYAFHKEKWKHCERCQLWSHRVKVVLCRGKLPCDVLFIGEAPGISEDVIGKPFVGPAGRLLEVIIDKSLDGRTFAMTNLVACIPRLESGEKWGEPPKESIEECAPRLRELIGLAHPKLFVTVGALSARWLPKVYKNLPIDRTVQITHPAAILRMENRAQKDIAIQRCMTVLCDAVQNL